MAEQKFLPNCDQNFGFFEIQCDWLIKYVDASASYDKDARFNGKISEYEYTLANYRFSSPLSKIRYVFGSSGQKQIRVRVKDNSGDWSNQVSEYGFYIEFLA